MPLPSPPVRAIDCRARIHNYFAIDPARSSFLLTWSPPERAIIPKFTLVVPLLRAPSSAPIPSSEKRLEVPAAGAKYLRPLLKSVVHRLRPGSFCPVTKMFPPPPPATVKCRLFLYVSSVSRPPPRLILVEFCLLFAEIRWEVIDT